MHGLTPHPEEPAQAGVSKDGGMASWFETREDALLTMRFETSSRGARVSGRLEGLSH
jgi:hypothetical protein